MSGRLEGPAVADLVDHQQVAALARRASRGRVATPTSSVSAAKPTTHLARTQPLGRPSSARMSGLRTSAIGSGSAVGLLDLASAGGGRPEVGDRRGHHDRVGVGRRGRARRRAAAARSPTRTTLTPAGSGSATLAATSVTSAPRATAVRRQRVALPAAGPVAQEAHRVERLAGAAGGDDDVPAREVERAARRGRARASPAAKISAGLGQPPGAGVGAGEPPDCRLEHDGPARAQRRDVGLGGRVLPHLGVHRRARTRTGQRAVSRVAVSRSSARPVAARASRSAVAGATTHEVGLLAEPDVRDLVDVGPDVGRSPACRTAPPRSPRRRTAARPRSARRGRRGRTR